MSCGSGLDRWALIDALLPETVSRAREFVPLYSALHRGLPPVRCREELSLLPTVDKAVLAKSGSNALATNRRTDLLGNTSGTSGTCFTIHGCREEEEFVQDFFTAFAKANPSSTQTVVFSLGIPTHGQMRAIPVDCFSVSSCVLDEGTANNFAHYLKTAGEAMDVPEGLRVVSAFLDQLLLFTCYCIRTGQSLRDFEIDMISVTGDYISPRLRLLLEQHWGASLVERYSLSEIFGGASQHAHTAGFDFDRYVVPELADTDAGSTGELVLTTLYPFVQRQPMIRYRTGDIFTLANGRFVFRGRRGHCLRDPDSGEFLLYGSDLYDLFDEYPTVARQERSLDLTSRDLSATGKPLVTGRWMPESPPGKRVELSVGLTFDPAFHGKAVQTMRDEIVHKIEVLSQGRLTPSVDFVFGGGVARDSRFKKSGFLWQ